MGGVSPRTYSNESSARRAGCRAAIVWWRAACPHAMWGSGSGGWLGVLAAGLGPRATAVRA